MGFGGAGCWWCPWGRCWSWSWSWRCFVSAGGGVGVGALRVDAGVGGVSGVCGVRGGSVGAARFALLVLEVMASVGICADVHGGDVVLALLSLVLPPSGVFVAFVSAG